MQLNLENKSTDKCAANSFGLWEAKCMRQAVAAVKCEGEVEEEGEEHPPAL